MTDDSSTSITVLAFAGSLRRGSLNKRLLRAAQREAPDGMSIEIIELDDIPMYNADVEAEGDPEPVTRFKSAISDADAVLIATPEYMHGIPGVLKNALDWASRPPGESPLQDKPVAMMGASPSPVGTARAHLQLRRTLMYTESRVVGRPEVLVSDAGSKFDGDTLTDEDARGFVRQLLEKLADEVRSG